MTVIRKYKTFWQYQYRFSTKHKNQKLVLPMEYQNVPGSERVCPCMVRRYNVEIDISKKVCIIWIFRKKKNMTPEMYLHIDRFFVRKYALSSLNDSNRHTTQTHLPSDSLRIRGRSLLSLAFAFCPFSQTLQHRSNEDLQPHIGKYRFEFRTLVCCSADKESPVILIRIPARTLNTFSPSSPTPTPTPTSFQLQSSGHI